MLTGYMRTIPPDLCEAAVVDGASNFDLFRRIVLPLALPGLAATAAYVALVSWNEFILALTLTSARAYRTISVGLYIVLSEENQFQQHIVLALAMLMALPVAALIFPLTLSVATQNERRVNARIPGQLNVAVAVAHHPACG